jgi:hypothetical protein
MEITPPVHVVAQELHQQLFQQGVVLAIGAEETRIQHVVARLRRRHRHRGAHAACVRSDAHPGPHNCISRWVRWFMA